MNENEIKEELSISYIKIIAHSLGFDTDIPHRDRGIDLQIKKIVKRKVGTGFQSITAGSHLEIQLKATTEKQVTITTDGNLKYELKVKNYNDLIYKFKIGSPLVLILFVLPEETSNWTTLDEKQLILRKNAYWYVPEPEDEESENTSTITITIPKENILKEESIEYLFTKLYGLS